MGEPRPPHNPDQDVPARMGDDIGRREPIVPQPTPEPHERRTDEDASEPDPGPDRDDGRPPQR
jgi:hypothetical protein